MSKPVDESVPREALAEAMAIVEAPATVTEGSSIDSNDNDEHNVMAVSFDPNEAYYEEYELDPDYVGKMKAPDVDYETAELVVEDLADDTHMKEASVLLHDKIKQELIDAHHDPYAARRDIEKDPLLSSSMKLVHIDEKARKKMKGPTIKREKFTSNYWAQWNREKNLLEDISLKEKIKEDALLQTKQLRDEKYRRSLYGGDKDELEVPQYLDATNTTLGMTNTVTLPPMTNLNHSSTKKKLSLKKPLYQSMMKGHSFDAPKGPHADNRSKFFDSHLLGDNSVAFLWSRRFQRPVPKHPTDRRIHKNDTRNNNIPTETECNTLEKSSMKMQSKLSCSSAEANRDDNHEKKSDAIVSPSASDSVFRQFKHIKGGSIPLESPNRPNLNKEQLLTQNIEPLGPAEFGVDESNGRRKGPIFDTAMRFKATSESVAASSSGANAVDQVSSNHKDITERHPVISVGFNSGDRFPKQTDTGGVIVQIPVESTSVPIESYEAKDRLYLGTSSESITKENNYERSEEEENQEPLQCIPCTNNAQSNTVVQPQQQQYVEYEYYPNDDPGPAHYHIPRLFDNTKSADFKALYMKHKDPPPGLNLLSGFDLTRVGKFGYGCNRQEHVLYGMCLDGKCCRRGYSETLMMQRNDLRRLSGYQAVKRFGRNKERIMDEMIYSDAMMSLLPTAKYTIDPLYAAAYAGDVEVIGRLSKLHVNPNLQHPESKYTPLHAAVFRCQLKSVIAIVNHFRGVVLFDLQDKKGNTPLHLAAAAGYYEIAGVICDEENCDPLSKKNYYAKYPIDIVKNHKTFQMIKVCQDRNALKAELALLRRSNRHHQ